MMRINLAAGSKDSKDKYPIHPRVMYYDNAAHIVTPLFKGGMSEWGTPQSTWAKITVKRSWRQDEEGWKSYFQLRKVYPFTNPEEN